MDSVGRWWHRNNTQVLQMRQECKRNVRSRSKAELERNDKGRKERTMSYGILPIEDIKSCGVSADKSTDQNVADVPSEKTIVNDCDLISREDAIETVQTYLNILIDSRRHGDDVTSINVLTDISNKITALPSADRPTDESCQDCPIYSAEEKNCPRFNKVIPQTRAEMLADRLKGEWLIIDFDLTPFNYEGFYCSNCRHIYDYKMNFCPNCGADMRGEDDG